MIAVVAVLSFLAGLSALMAVMAVIEPDTTASRRPLRPPHRWPPALIPRWRPSRPSHARLPDRLGSADDATRAPHAARAPESPTR